MDKRGTMACYREDGQQRPSRKQEKRRRRRDRPVPPLSGEGAMREERETNLARKLVWPSSRDRLFLLFLLVRRLLLHLASRRGGVDHCRRKRRRSVVAVEGEEGLRKGRRSSLGPNRSRVRSRPPTPAAVVPAATRRDENEKKKRRRGGGEEAHDLVQRPPLPATLHSRMRSDGPFLRRRCPPGGEERRRRRRSHRLYPTRSTHPKRWSPTGGEGPCQGVHPTPPAVRNAFDRPRRGKAVNPLPPPKRKERRRRRQTKGWAGLVGTTTFDSTFHSARSAPGLPEGDGSLFARHKGRRRQAGPTRTTTGDDANASWGLDIVVFLRFCVLSIRFGAGGVPPMRKRKTSSTKGRGRGNEWAESPLPPLSAWEEEASPAPPPKRRKDDGVPPLFPSCLRCGLLAPPSRAAQERRAFLPPPPPPPPHYYGAAGEDGPLCDERQPRSFHFPLVCSPASAWRKGRRRGK